MNKPTEAQVKEFWEGCGCKVVSFPFFLDESKTVYDLVFPDKSEQRYTDNLQDSIDLNNLFRYAVPKLSEDVGGDSIEISFLCPTTECSFWVVQITNRRITMGQAQGDTDAQALFMAIWEMSHAENTIKEN